MKNFHHTSHQPGIDRQRAVSGAVMAACGLLSAEYRMPVWLAGDGGLRSDGRDATNTLDATDPLREADG